MGQSFLSRSAVICVFVAITFVSYCFGKYVIGGKFMKRDESVVSHIPRGYRASTDSSQPDEASPAGKSASLEHGATDGGSPQDIIPDTPRISIELAKPSDTGEPESEANPEEPAKQPKAADLPKPASERASSTSNSRKPDRPVPAADNPNNTQKPKETKPAVKTPATPVLAARTKGKTTPPQPVPTPKASSPAKAPRVDSVTTNADTTYRVIVGSFESQDNSRTMATQLNKKGYYTWTTKKEVGGKTLYRVQVGAFQDRDKADQVRRDLETQGYRASVSGG